MKQIHQKFYVIFLKGATFSDFIPHQVMGGVITP